MTKQKTLSDSKEAFYKQFPYVIPNIYRRIADEILVELYLLSNNKSFQEDPLFDIGLYKTFNELTKGYRPKKHIGKLFEAICNSNGFDHKKIIETNEREMKELKTFDISKIKSYLDQKESKNKNNIQKELKILDVKPKSYNRLNAIGLFIILQAMENKENCDINIENMAKELSNEIGYPQDRVEKDITLFVRSLEKIAQSIEIMNIAQKKKN